MKDSAQILNTVSIFQPDDWSDRKTIMEVMRATRRIHGQNPFVSSAKKPDMVNSKYEYQCTQEMGGVLHQYTRK